MNFLTEVQGLSEDSITIYIGAAEGAGTGINVAGAMSEVREAAVGRELTEVVLKYELRELGQGSYRFEGIVKRALQAIKRMGDDGLLAKDDDTSIIYWTFCQD